MKKDSYVFGYQTAMEEIKKRTCENCKYFTTPQYGFSVCEKIGNTNVPNDFGCNRWEAKDAFQKTANKQ